jgi:hypothetical protein
MKFLLQGPVAFFGPIFETGNDIIGNIPYEQIGHGHTLLAIIMIAYGKTNFIISAARIGWRRFLGFSFPARRFPGSPWRDLLLLNNCKENTKKKEII